MEGITNNVCMLPDKFFVTGTDTGVGKTLVCASLMLGMKALYWKPVQSGSIDGTDRQWIQKATGLPDWRFLHETYCLSRPVSPHAAALADGVEIRMTEFRLPDTPPGFSLIVEGAGGVMVPLNDDCLMIDLIKQLALPVVVVARSSLGTINHTLMTLSVLRDASVEVAGVVLNGPENPSNHAAIEHYGKVRVLAHIKPLGTISPSGLMHVFSSFATGSHKNRRLSYARHPR